MMSKLRSYQVLAVEDERQVELGLQHIVPENEENAPERQEGDRGRTKRGQSEETERGEGGWGEKREREINRNRNREEKRKRGRERGVREMKREDKREKRKAKATLWGLSGGSHHPPALAASLATHVAGGIYLL